MARKSNQHRDKRRQKLIMKFREKRAELRNRMKEGDEDAMVALQKQPRDASYIRNTRRCASCGRPHGTLRRFGMCRICLRKYAMSGLIPGIKKSSW